MLDRDVYNYLAQDNRHNLRREKAKPLNKAHANIIFWHCKIVTLYFRFHHVQDHKHEKIFLMSLNTIVDDIASAKKGGSFSVIILLVHQMDGSWSFSNSTQQLLTITMVLLKKILALTQLTWKHTNCWWKLK